MVFDVCGGFEVLFICMEFTKKQNRKRDLWATSFYNSTNRDITIIGHRDLCRCINTQAQDMAE